MCEAHRYHLVLLFEDADQVERLLLADGVVANVHLRLAGRDQHGTMGWSSGGTRTDVSEALSKSMSAMYLAPSGPISPPPTDDAFMSRTLSVLFTFKASHRGFVQLGVAELVLDDADERLAAARPDPPQACLSTNMMAWHLASPHPPRSIGQEQEDCVRVCLVRHRSG